MTLESLTSGFKAYSGRVLVVLVGALLLIVTLVSSGQTAIGAPGEGKGDFAGPEPENMRSFSCFVDDTTGSCVFITNPGEQSNFVLTDLVLEGVGSTDTLAVRISSPGATELAVFRIRLDGSGFGNRDLHFETGLIAQTDPGSLSISKISGNGAIWATASGYYFNNNS